MKQLSLLCTWLLVLLAPAASTAVARKLLPEQSEEHAHDSVNSKPMMRKILPVKMRKLMMISEDENFAFTSTLSTLHNPNEESYHHLQLDTTTKDAAQEDADEDPEPTIAEVEDEDAEEDTEEIDNDEEDEVDNDEDNEEADNAEELDKDEDEDEEDAELAKNEEAADEDEEDEDKEADAMEAEAELMKALDQEADAEQESAEESANDLFAVTEEEMAQEAQDETEETAVEAVEAGGGEDDSVIETETVVEEEEEDNDPQAAEAEEEKEEEEAAEEATLDDEDEEVDKDAEGDDEDEEEDTHGAEDAVEDEAAAEEAAAEEPTIEQKMDNTLEKIHDAAEDVMDLASQIIKENEEMANEDHPEEAYNPRTDADVDDVDWAAVEKAEAAEILEAEEMYGEAAEELEAELETEELAMEREEAEMEAELFGEPELADKEGEEFGAGYWHSSYWMDNVNDRKMNPKPSNADGDDLLGAVKRGVWAAAQVPYKGLRALALIQMRMFNNRDFADATGTLGGKAVEDHY